MTVKAVLSDLGNVVAMYSMCSFLERFGDIAAVAALLPPNKTADGLDRRAAIEAAIGSEVAEYELGRLGDGEFVRRVSRRLGLAEPAVISQADFNRVFVDIFSLNEEVADLWQRLRREQGITLVAVSNLCPVHERSIRRIGAMDPFDHLLLSHQEGRRKPSTELMVRALDRAGAAAEEAVFIDDLEVNLKPAADLGIRIHCYRSFPELCDFLEGCGLVIS